MGQNSKDAAEQEVDEDEESGVILVGKDARGERNLSMS